MEEVLHEFMHLPATAAPRFPGRDFLAPACQSINLLRQSGPDLFCEAYAGICDVDELAEARHFRQSGADDRDAEGEVLVDLDRVCRQGEGH